MTDAELNELAEMVVAASADMATSLWSTTNRLLAEDNLALRAKEAALAEEKHGAYAERDALVCALSKLWPSHLARHPEDDVTWDDEWRWIVCLHSPVGQLTWHIKDSERKWFYHLTVDSGHWDGHTTPEKYQRLASLTAGDATCPRCGALSMRCGTCGWDRFTTAKPDPA